ncbi:MAG: type II toxin-antitoxin system VapC family toxin [Acidobacteriota bacterium]|nr:type II toxin-antitoxin system VapC family toxin [Acidobacteriota bacterium]MDH3522870.1 type II toxin-antitoxin system VapC family toxin [Acidobacteriota bacterium]
MIFWDSSAIVPLLVEEPATQTVHDIVRRDPAIVVWWATRVECTSALSRLEREDRLPVDTVDAARDRLAELARSWTEVLPTDDVRSQAARLLLRHALRAADALQLAAALAWGGAEPERHELCTFDERLSIAARGEGFRLLPAVSAS